MLHNQIRIDKHKADIDKRITQLETKLKQPIRVSQNFTHEVFDDHNNQYRRNLVQRQQYVQPKQVAALRQRQLNIKQTQQINQQSQNQSNIHDFNFKKRASSNSSCIEQEKKRKRSPQDYVSKSNHLQSINYSQRKNQTKQLYDLMTEILHNQKNLEKQLGLLRLQWNKQHIMKNTKGSTRPQQNSNYKNNNQYNKNQVISFQDQQISGQPRAFDIINKDEKIDHEIRQGQQNQIPINTFMGSARKRAQNKYRNHQNQVQTFAIHKQENQSRGSIDLQQKIINRQKIRNYSKRVHKAERKQAEVQQKLFNLVKSQKTRGQRCRVKQQNKNQIWKKVEHRIKVSQNEYKQSFHRNNRYEHEHLINTNQLQKKLRQDIIIRIHHQSNNYLYK